VPIKMAHVYGARRADAEKTLREAGFRGRIVTEIVTEQTLGPVDFARADVCSQSPEPGEQTTTDQRIVLGYCDPDRPPPSRLGAPTLSGASVEEARRRARSFAFAGRIEVVPLNEFDAGCKPATVCRISPLRWYANGTGVLTLFINKPLTITTPN